MTTPHAAHGDHDHSGHDHAGHSHDGHSHGGLGHSHAPKDFGPAFALGTALNVAFVVVEAIAGFMANSMALVADAGHNLGDVLGLLMAWGASILVKRRATFNFTYGFGSSTILAALANAVLLLVAVGAIALEAVQRLIEPAPVVGSTMIIVASIGILINGFTAWLFMSGRERDVNIRGAYLHMVADAAVSFGVVLVGIALLLTGWDWLDPLVSLVVGGIIVWGTWGLLRDSIRLAMHGVPVNIDPGKVQARLAALPGVVSIHDLHIWPMSTTETALTCHLVMPGGHPGDAFIATAAKMLHDEFEIRHSTLQFEVSADAPCGLEHGCAPALEPMPHGH
ncbi:cation diffusion facilitator family transporter [Hyphomicrobium sp. MC1]|uniref:cation diffusion facilitator family transporter n=1 Tax=Hyphomicrobium sp. (strain MC1) TaxID=717785 RepID=UPI000213DD69|nr:cation diffusion facilitator family transporter [Hyphomicrobium sp. MC1]CCB66381.1 putative cation efflux system protein [Hyphomicrobium sp. MC1]